MIPEDWVEVRKGTASLDIGRVVEATDVRCVLELDGLGRREYRRDPHDDADTWHEASGRPVVLEIVTPADIRKRQRRRASA